MFLNAHLDKRLASLPVFARFDDPSSSTTSLYGVDENREEDSSESTSRNGKQFNMHLEIDMMDTTSLPVFSRPMMKSVDDSSSPMSLYSVDETTCDEDGSEFTSTSASTSTEVASRALSLPAVPCEGRKRRSSQKPKRLQLVKTLAADAKEYTETGEENKALDAYRQAIKIAGSEIARVNHKIKKSRRLNEVARASIQDRLREDLGKIGISIGRFRTKMAIIYDRLGEWDEALLCCREALEVYKHQPEIQNPKTKVPSSSSLIQAMESMIERMETLMAALTARDAQMQNMDELRDELQHTVEVSEKHLVYAEIQKLAEDMLATEVKALGSSHPQIAESLQLLSTVALERGNHVQAAEYLHKATEIGLKCLGNKHPRIGQYHLRLARIHVSHKQHDMALTNYQKAIDVLFHSPRFSRTLASTYNDVAAIHIQQNEIDLAIENLHCALKQFEKALIIEGQNHETEASDSLQVYNNLGQCYMKKLNFTRARESFTKVLEVQRKSRKVYDNVKDLGLGMVGVEDGLLSLIEDENVAETLVHLGRAFGAEQQHERALGCFEEALEILNSVELSSRNERMLERNKLVTKTLFCVGEESFAVGNYDRASQAYNESARLAIHGSEDGSSIHCCLCYMGIGKVYTMRSEYTGAIRIYSKTLRHCKNSSLPSTHPIVIMTKEKIEEVKTKMGEATPSEERDDELARVERAAQENMQASNYDAAVQNLKEAMRIRRESLAKQRALKENSASEIDGIANLLESFGLVYAKQGDFANSGRAFSEAYKLRSHYQC